MISKKSTWFGALFVALLFIAFFTLFYGFAWMTMWWVWLVIVLTTVVLALCVQGIYFAAGADWLRTRDGWVDTYELTDVGLHVHGVKIDLSLKDSSGRSTTNPIADLQANRDLWDLVYNGIRHSAANGAKVNAYARSALKLDTTQEAE